MELQTISQVSREYGISARMLRYYEQEGLIESRRKEDYAYRVYDEKAIRQLQEIIILRKLRIPVKQISSILSNQDASTAIRVFIESIKELEDEITALSTIKSILSRLVLELQEKANVKIRLDLLGDTSVLPLIGSLSSFKNQVKGSLSMEELNTANEVISKLQDVRIVYLPPMTVAASHHAGQDSEGNASRPLNQFVLESGLLKIKPDARHFGFNNSLKRSGIGEPSPGYEMWVSIPDDMDVPAPLFKRKFFGGLYAAHAIKMAEWDHWLGLQDWVNDSEIYESDMSVMRCEPYMQGMDPCLEEQLNFYTNVQNPDFDNSSMQLDLLMPIKLIQPIDETSFEIEGSKERCGFKATLVAKNKFGIMGFTKIITPELGDEAVLDFWMEAKADGRLDMLLMHKKPGAQLLGFSSYDGDSRRQGGWRYTICLSEPDITDKKAFKACHPFVKKIDSSKWLCFELTKETLAGGFNPHKSTPELGYMFNGPISGFFDVFPEGSNRILDKNSKSDGESVVYCWFPVG